MPRFSHVSVITKNAQIDVPFPHVIEESSEVVRSHVPNREVVICGTHMKSVFFFLNFGTTRFSIPLLPSFVTAVLRAGETLPVYWWCTEQMLAVPGADGCDQLLDDGGTRPLCSTRTPCWRLRPPRTGPGRHEPRRERREERTEGDKGGERK